MLSPKNKVLRGENKKTGDFFLKAFRGTTKFPPHYYFKPSPDEWLQGFYDIKKTTKKCKKRDKKDGKKSLICINGFLRIQFNQRKT